MKPVLTRTQAQAAASAFVAANRAGAEAVRVTFPLAGGGANVRFCADGHIHVTRWRAKGRTSTRRYDTLAVFDAEHREVA